MVSWATLTISLHWPMLWAISFSQKTCLPAFMALMATGAWSQSGRAMTTISTPGRRASASTSADTLELGDVGGRVFLVAGELLDPALELRGADVAEADVVDVGPVVVADHGLAAFVAGADDRGADRGLVPHRLVAEVEGAQAGGDGGGLEEVASGRADHLAGVGTAQGSLVGGQVQHRLRVRRSGAIRKGKWLMVHGLCPIDKPALLNPFTHSRINDLMAAPEGNIRIGGS